MARRDRARAYYTVLTQDGAFVRDSTEVWPLPDVEGEPAAWTTPAPEDGHRVMSAGGLPVWLEEGGVVWRVEVTGAMRPFGGVYRVCSARLVERVGVVDRRLLVAWAADCAERVLPLYERLRSDSSAARDALALARDWLQGRAATWQVWPAVERMEYSVAQVAAELDAVRGTTPNDRRATRSVTARRAAESATSAAFAMAGGAPDAYWAAARAIEAVRAEGLEAKRPGEQCFTGSVSAERRWQSERLLAYLRGEAAAPDSVRTGGAS